MHVYKLPTPSAKFHTCSSRALTIHIHVKVPSCLDQGSTFSVWQARRIERASSRALSRSLSHFRREARERLLPLGMSEQSRGNDGSSRRALVQTAMASFQKLRTGKFAVVICKGGLAFGQVTILVTLLILSAVTIDGRRQLDPSAHCGHTRLFEAWMVVNAVRLTVCWLVSLWVVLRAGVDGVPGQDEEDVLAEARAQRARNQQRRPTCMTYTSSTGSMNTLSASPESTSCFTLSNGPNVPAHASLEKSLPRGQAVGSEKPFTPSISARLAKALDRAAPRISTCLAIISFALFITGNILVFSPVPKPGVQTCKQASPFLWWGVMAVTAVGWFLLAQVVLIVGIVGIGGSAVMSILRAINLVAPLPVPLPPRAPPPAPLSIETLRQVRLARYAPRASEASASTVTLDPDHASCLVCLNDYAAGEQLRVLTCEHCFHPDCIDPWLVKSSARCPACNAAVAIDGGAAPPA